MRSRIHPGPGCRGNRPPKACSGRHTWIIAKTFNKRSKLSIHVCLTSRSRQEASSPSTSMSHLPTPPLPGLICITMTPCHLPVERVEWSDGEGRVAQLERCDPQCPPRRQRRSIRKRVIWVRECVLDVLVPSRVSQGGNLITIDGQRMLPVEVGTPAALRISRVIASYLAQVKKTGRTVGE